jgi:tRNA uridine 5-carboxymethylaminomethyl modification enzyme
MFAAKQAVLERAMTLLGSLTLTPAEGVRVGLRLNQDGVRRSAFDLLAHPETDWARLSDIWPELRAVPPAIAAQLAIEAQYSAYLHRQRADIEATRRDEALELPPDLDYAAIAGLSTEVRQKLAAARPANLGQAGRLEGVTPAALTRLLGHVRRRRRDAA